MTLKQRNILIKFLLWSITLFVILFIGINNIFALETKTIYPTSNFSQNANNYVKIAENGSIGITNVGITVSGVAYGFNFYFQETISTNKTYTLITNFMSDDLLKTFQSNYVHINTCSGSSCYDCTIISVEKNNNNANSNKLTIKYTAPISGSYFNVSFISDGPPYQALTGVSNFGIRSIQLDSTSDTNDIINNQNQNANNIINNQNSNTQDIIDSQNSSASSIINSQESSASSIIDSQNSSASAIIDSSSANADRIIEENKKNFTSCRDSYNLSSLSSVYIDTSYYRNIPTVRTLEPGNYTVSFDVSSLDTSGGGYLYINVAGVNYQMFQLQSLSLNSRYSYSFYVSSSFDTSRYSIGATAFNNGSRITLTNIMLQSGNYATDFEEPNQEICINKLDESEITRKGILGKLGDLISNLFSNDNADISGLNNMVGWLPPGPVDSIINLPLSLFNSLTNVLSGTCHSISLTLPFVNQNLVLPCFDSFMSQNLTGFSTFWTWLGVTMSVFILYRYLLTLYAWIDKTLTMRENNLPGYYDENMWGGA